MPLGNPLGYLPPEVQSALLGLATGGIPGFGDGLGEMLAPPLTGAAPTPSPFSLAAPVRGHSLPQYRGTDDDMLIRFIRNPNLPAKTRERAMQEYNIRVKYGAFGIPGTTPVDPQLG